MVIGDTAQLHPEIYDIRMGGHAFAYQLNTPRIPPTLYNNLKIHVTVLLSEIFANVTVPSELPEKETYGDIDFLVSGSFTQASGKRFEYDKHVKLIKSALGTPHGRMGIKTDKVMFFAVSARPFLNIDTGHASEHDQDIWVQVDIRVCEKEEVFHWQRWQLQYASMSKILGSMLKPLGITMNMRGCWLRVECLDGENFEDSLVWLTHDPKDILKFLGLNKKMLQGSFSSMDEIYEYITCSWLFNPAHFSERLKDGGYSKHLQERSAPWVDLVMRWIPEHYPGYRQFGSGEESKYAPTFESALATVDIHEWYRMTRGALREKIFTMLPNVATTYYEKHRSYTQMKTEEQLRSQIKAAIPAGSEGWREAGPQPPLMIKPIVSLPSTETDGAVQVNTTSQFKGEVSNPIFSSSPRQIPWTYLTRSPIYLDALPRTPPVPFIPRAPPEAMSTEAKLTCLYRWTLFTPDDGSLFIAPEPREKKSEMCWSVFEGDHQELVEWAGAMWWHVWARQDRVNYQGMWRRRIEKEDAKSSRGAVESGGNEENKVQDGKVTETLSQAPGDMFEGAQAKNDSLNMVNGVENNESRVEGSSTWMEKLKTINEGVLEAGFGKHGASAAGNGF